MPGSRRDSPDPLRAFAALRDEGFKILLHSQSGSGISYLIKPREFRRLGVDKLRSFRAGTSPPGSRFLKQGDTVFLVSYDAGREFESLPDANPRLVDVPDCVVAEVDHAYVFDHSSGTWSPEPPPCADAPSDCQVSEWEELLSDAEYEKIVRRAKEYIAAGDIYQVNLARWFTAGFEGGPFGYFSRLCRRNPSPYATYVEMPPLGGRPSTTIISSSPELLVSCDGRRVVTRPIAGTYPKTKSPHELPRDPKERAEHVMLIDLERNDLGRLCRPGTVKVEELLGVEEYSHLYHIVSQVAGELAGPVEIYDLLRAVFPGGTITGTPKVRAMEIIDELESFRRGYYTGGVGILNSDGYFVMNILIRTAVFREGRIHLAAGAGIVADSDPAREAAETRMKAAAFIERSDE